MNMPTSGLVGLNPTTTILPNGVRLLAKQTGTTPAVTISLTVRAGSVHDPLELPGVAFLLSRVIDRGTSGWSTDEIAEALDIRGVSLRVAVTRHTLSISCDCLAEDFDTVLQLLADVVRNPVIPENELVTRRGEVLTAIRQDQDSPATVAMERLMKLLYGATHPYGQPTKGTPASVGQMGRDRLQQFHREHFAPGGLSVVVVGDVMSDHVAEVVTEAFGSWEPRTSDVRPPESPEPATTRRRVVIPMMNKSQSDIGYGFTTVARADPAYYAYWLMSNIFGQYGMGGRLGQSIRERQGMAYYAFCGFEAGVIAGPLIVRAGVSGDNVDKAVASIDAEVASLAADGVTDDELANSQRYLTGSLPRQLETNAGIAAFLQEVQQFDLGLDYDLRVRDLIDRVTRDQVNEAARLTLAPERAAVVIAGPYQDSTDDQVG